MARVTIYHNPKCSKSRDALALLQYKKVNLRVVDYMQSSLTEKILLLIVKYLKCPVSHIVRTKDKLFKEVCNDSRKISDQKYFKLLIKYPSLLQRPIVMFNRKAVIARPPENIHSLLEE